MIDAHILAFISNLIQGWDLPVILLVALLVFNARIPRVAKSIGQMFSEFGRAVKSEKDTSTDDTAERGLPEARDPSDSPQRR